MALKESFQLYPIISHLVKVAIGNLDDNQTLMEIIPNIIRVSSPKVWVDHTQC
jgi:hypothetical protein